MGKIIVITGENLHTEEYDTIQEATDKVAKEIEDGDLSPMDCEIIEGEIRTFEVKINITKGE